MAVFPVESIYDAAADERLFPDLLRHIVAHFGAQSGFLAWMGGARGSGFQAEYGNDPAYLQAYVETYAPLDILRPALMDVPEGRTAPRLCSAAVGSDQAKPFLPRISRAAADRRQSRHQPDQARGYVCDDCALANG